MRVIEPFLAALADVVDADVELVMFPVPAAPEHLRVAAGDVVRFEHQRALARGAQVRGARQPAES